MKVGELIRALEKCDPEDRVVLSVWANSSSDDLENRYVAYELDHVWRKPDTGIATYKVLLQSDDY